MGAARDADGMGVGGLVTRIGSAAVRCGRVSGVAVGSVCVAAVFDALIFMGSVRGRVQKPRGALSFVCRGAPLGGSSGGEFIHARSFYFGISEDTGEGRGERRGEGRGGVPLVP